jgi:hypothetical protein
VVAFPGDHQDEIVRIPDKPPVAESAPRGGVPDEAVAFVARQVGVEPTELGFYEWTGRTIE